jgi:CrcB protein
VAFGPIGALLRYNLSLRNAKHPKFPVYTFVVNLSGCLGNISVFVLANYLSHSRLLNDYWLAAFDLWILNGVTVGLMGSLSTVSTWVNEIWKLANNGHLYYSYRYAAISVMCAQAICLSIGVMYMLITGRKLPLTGTH